MRAPLSSPRATAGFTLVEVMVGMVLAMLTTVIVSQVLLRAEGQKRSATSGSDAQVNGNLALFTLQRELQNAGYGLAVNPSALGCPVNYRYKGSSGAAAATAGSFTLAPIVIAQGPSGTPDVLRVLRCGHRFHLECIDRWLLSSTDYSRPPACPICNARS